VINERLSTTIHESHNGAPTPPGDAPPAGWSAAETDAALDELQVLLFGPERERLRELYSHLNQMNHSLTAVEREVQRLNDIEALAEKIRPSLAPAISASVRESREGMVEALSPIIDRLITTSIENSRDSMVNALLPIIDRLISTSVRESRDSMVDALYPIIGRLVSRAVSQALRDLVRRIDDQMRSALDVKLLVRRLQARMAGISEAELALRSVLPFQVRQIFLIHGETGLLLNALAEDPELTADSDLISGMLTAIRDFAQDAIGRNQEGDLDEVQYGDQRILIETARYVYIALVAEGIEPIGFRADVHDRLLEIEQHYLSLLRNYDGNAAPLAATTVSLQPLLIKAAVRAVDGVPVGPLHTVPLRRQLVRARLAPAVRLTYALVLLVFLLALWRAWQTLGPVAIETNALFNYLLSIWLMPG
jgi:CRISPR/Cas system CSM-associated protein Csm2 small subunit